MHRSALPSPLSRHQASRERFGEVSRCSVYGSTCQPRTTLQRPSTFNMGKGIVEYNSPMGAELFLPNSFPIHPPREPGALSELPGFRFSGSEFQLADDITPVCYIYRRAIRTPFSNENDARELSVF